MTNEKNDCNNKIRKPLPSSIAALARMKAAKPKNTAPEKALRSALHRKGLRYRINRKPIPELNRTADIIIRPIKVAIFVDGCFWHGCPIHGTQSKANAKYWSWKIKQNIARDNDTNERLTSAGWIVIRVWEHEDPEDASQRILETIKLRKQQLI